jgi:hypothetical protein
MNTSKQTGGFMYYIYDENGEMMRKVKHKAEAKRLVNIYQGWTYKYIKPIKPVFNFASFMWAPF